MRHPNTITEQEAIEFIKISAPTERASLTSLDYPIIEGKYIDAGEWRPYFCNLFYSLFPHEFLFLQKCGFDLTKLEYLHED